MFDISIPLNVERLTSGQLDAYLMKPVSSCFITNLFSTSTMIESPVLWIWMTVVADCDAGLINILENPEELENVLRYNVGQLFAFPLFLMTLFAIDSSPFVKLSVRVFVLEFI